MPKGELVLQTSVVREAGNLYYLKGNPLQLYKTRAGRRSGGAASSVLSTGERRESGYLYFTAGSVGSRMQIRRSKMVNRRRKAPPAPPAPFPFRG